MQYHKLLVWDIEKAPKLTRYADRVLNPLVGKSLVVYLEKPRGSAALELDEVDIEEVEVEVIEAARAETDGAETAVPLESAETSEDEEAVA